MARRRYLTKTQRRVLQCMAENNGRAIIGTGTRWSVYRPGYAHIFGQGMHSLLQNRWITSRGANDLHQYAWTLEGKLAHERGWYYPQNLQSYHLDEKRMPFAE